MDLPKDINLGQYHVTTRGRSRAQTIVTTAMTGTAIVTLGYNFIQHARFNGNPIGKELQKLISWTQSRQSRTERGQKQLPAVASAIARLQELLQQPEYAASTTDMNSVLDSIFEQLNDSKIPGIQSFVSTWHEHKDDIRRELSSRSRFPSSSSRAPGARSDQPSVLSR